MSGFSEAEQRHLEGTPFAPGAALTATLRLGPGGRVVIPADMREAMGLKQGDALVAKLSGGELTMVTMMGLVRELQVITNKYVPEGVSVVDEFIAERRAEAARELED
jgi:AbrB family looped-hinge helix DNA binding protein